SEALVMVWFSGEAAKGGDRIPLSVADLLDWRAQSQSFYEIGGGGPGGVNYTGGGTPERGEAASLTAQFFFLLGGQPAHGRIFQPDEEKPGAQRVVLLSDRFWRQHFAADPEAVGRTINLSGTAFTVIGVMPPALNFPSREVEMWTTLQLQPPTRRGPY